MMLSSDSISANIIDTKYIYLNSIYPFSADNNQKSTITIYGSLTIEDDDTTITSTTNN
jgi:hypothetical protein